MFDEFLKDNDKNAVEAIKMWIEFIMIIELIWNPVCPGTIQQDG